MKDDRLISLNAAVDAMLKLQTEDIEAYGASIPEGFDGDRAVTALKALPSATDTNVGGNLIDRQAAIDALNGIKISRNASWYEFYQKAITAVGELPSAQPNLDEWCDDCKEYDKERHSCPRWNRVIRQTVDDVKKERKPCNGCKHMGNDFKCNRCVRAAQDNYEPWEGGQDERFD